MSATVEPLCTFVLSRGSILDTLYVSQTPRTGRTTRRPAYATTTEGPVTTIWRVDVRGNISEVAQIHWQPSSSTQPRQSSVLINGQFMLVENILQRSKRFFGSDSRTFVAGDMRCKWKSGKGGSVGSSHTGTAGQPTYDGSSAAQVSPYTSSQVWTCYDASASAARPVSACPSRSTDLSSIVALFFPPQSGLIKNELTVFPRGKAIVDHILLTAVLVCARKDEWRSAQSSITRSALEASLKAEIRGSLPPYSPTASTRSRVPSSPRLRRPHSTNATRSRYVSTQAPPPYTSADDVSVRPR